MNSFDDLPKRNRNHLLEDEAEAAFRSLISQSEDFIYQGPDLKDYGIDCQIEVTSKGQASNVRIHVQLKGTESTLNADGSLSIAVDRTNLNYLLAQPYSIYVAYHALTKSLYVCVVDEVLRRYANSEKNWTGQQTLTVSFTEELTVDRLRRLASLALSESRIARNRRIAQTTATFDAFPAMFRAAKQELYVPVDEEPARQLAEKLYESGEDETLSAAFKQFLSVFGAEHDAMGFCHMAEINLGMGYRTPNKERIEAALAYFQLRLNSGRYQVGSLLYTIGNALSALGREQEAKFSYTAALQDQDFSRISDMAAQCYKNLGTSLERLGEEDAAVEHYLEALQLSPNLPEAHNALAHYYHRTGRYEEALKHFDCVVFTDRQLGRTSAISGWRINTLFNLDDTRAAFREINILLSNAVAEQWIWPWCARQVAAFGRISVESAQHAFDFWDRYIATYPELGRARTEKLLTSFYLRSQDEDIGEYFQFRTMFEYNITFVDAEDAALLWDRLGHWAQDEGNWEEAEACYRKAYELAGGHYGYCLGTALNFLGRFEESLPILIEQAEHIQPDAMSWFQVGVANENTGRYSKAIAAYEKAIELDPEYDLAMFNLGGVHWNEGNIILATQIWRAAIEKFPDHELVVEVRAIAAQLL